MNIVTINGKEFSLEGKQPELGSKIIDFELRANDGKVHTNKDYDGKVLMILTVPSIDTPVCDMEIQKFNLEVREFPQDIKIICVSADLPVAQARWAASTDIKNIEMLSDHFSVKFAKDYGILIKDLRLLSRAVFVYDKQGKLVYRELIKEITKEPDYSKGLQAAKEIL